MANGPLVIHADPFLEAVRHTLDADIREALRAPLMAQAERYVDEAVDRAMAGLKIKLDAWVDHADMSSTVRVIYEKKESSK